MPINFTDHESVNDLQNKRKPPQFTKEHMYPLGFELILQVLGALVFHPLVTAVRNKALVTSKLEDKEKTNT